MLEINLKIEPEFLPIIYDVSREMALNLTQELAIDLHLEDDEILYDAWESCLLDSVRIDCEHLLFFLEDERLGRETFYIEGALAEPILRACSAIRIKLSNIYLNNINPDELENGMVDFEDLLPESQRAYICFVFLASLQDILVQELDPSLKTL